MKEEGPEEEWWEEEGWYEEAAYHPGSKGQREAHAEQAQLVQPLDEGSAEGQGSNEEAKLVALCKNELNSVTGASQHGACARYAHWYSGVVKVAKAVWHGFKKAAKYVTEAGEDLSNDLKYVEPPPSWQQTFSKLPGYQYGIPPLE